MDNKLYYKVTNIKDSILLIKCADNPYLFKNFDIIEFVLKECERNNKSKVLLDTSQMNIKNLNVMNQFYLGEGVAEILTGKIRFAVFGDEEIFTGLSETVAMNRGAKIKVSADYNVLVSWLNE